MLSDALRVRVSKLMAYFLRHDLKIPRNSNGWVPIESLLDTIRQKGLEISLEDLVEVVEKDPKGRYEISNDKIRARYGHSVDVSLELPEGEKDILFHGTTPEIVRKIIKEGIQPMGRKMVHLSAVFEEAVEVGKRRTPFPVIIKINARKAKELGIKILKASEKVYLAKYIPPECIVEVKATHEGKERVL